MDPDKLKAMLTKSAVTIKDGEGLSVLPSGNCPGVIYLGATRKIVPIIGAAKDAKDIAQFKIIKPTRELDAMRYLQPMNEQERKELGRTFGTSHPMGLTDALKARFSFLKEAERRTGQPLQCAFTTSRLGLHAAQPAVVCHWEVHPVEDGVWAVVWDGTDEGTIDV